MLGKTLGHYRIEHQLGAGGMGVVYRAHDARLERPVAIKLLGGDAASPDARRRLLHEARSASSLNHPHICTVYEIAEAGDVAFIVMEYVEGRGLGEVIPRDGLAGETVVRYGSQIADALAHAHARGVIHGDLKSANVMITPEGRAKVLDFGLATRLCEGPIDRLTCTHASLIEAGRIAGTLAYMAPELLRGEPPSVRSDLWALGVLLHEMAAGALPFQGETGFTLTGAILHETPQVSLAGRPPALRSLILRCLAKEPAHRYEDAREVRVALESVQSGVFVAPVGDVGSVTDGRRSVLVLPFVNVGADPETDFFSDGLTDEIIADLSKVHSLRVISRTSSMRLKGSSQDIAAIARSLNVEYVLEGTVRVSGSQLRMTARLVDAGSDSPIWGHKYSGSLDDVFAIQENVSRSIVGELRLKLSPEEDRRLAERPMNDPRAYESYLRARQEILKFTKAGLDRALEYLQASAAIVGESVHILAAMGEAYWQYVNGGVSADLAYLDKAEACAGRILALDPDSVHGHRLIGLARAHRGDLKGSLAQLKVALDRDPTDSNTLFWGSLLASMCGRMELAKQWAARLVEIDPLTPSYQVVPGVMALMDGNPRRALDVFEKHVDSTSDSPITRLIHGQALAQSGQLAEAFSHWEALERDFPDNPFATLGRFYRLALQGRGDEAYATITPELAEALGRDPQYSWFVAECCALAGRRQEALDWLERAVSLGFIHYPLLHRDDPFLEPVRVEPRFESLMHEVEERWKALEV